MDNQKRSDPPSRSISHPEPNRSAARRPTKNDGISPQFVLHAVRRWWKLAAPLGIVLATVAVAAVFLLFKPTYRAVGQIRILENQPHIAFPPSGGSEDRQFVATQLELFRLPIVLYPVAYDAEIAKHPELQMEPDPLAYLQRAVHVDVVENSEIYEVEYSASDPAHAKQMVDKVIASYMKYVNKHEAELQSELSLSLDREMERRIRETELLQEQVRKLGEEAGVTPTNPTPGVAGPDPISDMRALLVQAEVDIIMHEAAIEFERKRANDPIDVTDRDIERVVGAELQLRRDELEAQRREYEDLVAKTPGNSSPFLRQESTRLKSAEAAFEKLASDLRLRVKIQLADGREREQNVRMEELEWRLGAAEATKETLTKRLEAVENDSGKQAGERLDVEFKHRELLVAEDMYQQLLLQRIRLSTEENAPARVFSLNGEEGVSTPTTPISAMPLNQMLIALLAGLVAPFGLAIGWELMQKRVNDVDEIRDQMGVAVLGEIVTLPRVETGRRTSKRAMVSRQLFEESVDGLRTSLVLADAMPRLQVLATASAVSSEGKTSVASQLAISLARTTGKPNLLIDGDMRAPDIHRMFDLPISPGLAEVLMGEIAIDDALAETSFRHLHVMTAGLLEMNPHRLVHNEKFQLLLEDLRERYEYVIIDTPPVLAASEALVLARHADATLVCAMRDRTRMRHIQLAHSRLDAAGARTIGVVMSGLPVRNYASRYGSYSYGSSSNQSY